jgi:hypothetical protein
VVIEVRLPPRQSTVGSNALRRAISLRIAEHEHEVDPRLLRHRVGDPQQFVHHISTSIASATTARSQHGQRYQGPLTSVTWRLSAFGGNAGDVLNRLGKPRCGFMAGLSDVHHDEPALTSTPS